MTTMTAVLADAMSGDPGAAYRHHLSLMHGWLPWTIQGVTVALLLVAAGWRSRRWRLLWLPVGIAVGAVLAVAAHEYIAAEGMAGDPAPWLLWAWIGVIGFAATVLIAGWRGQRWWRRAAALVALPLTLVCALLALNLWVGYFPTVQNAWNQLTAGPLPDQTDQKVVVAMQRAHQIPAKGTVVQVSIPSTASGFKHRSELVYLPPAWFATDPAPALPTVMMIGGEFNTPADWLRTGNAIHTVDAFAAAHDGNAPVLVFVDSGGSFNNDTECVDGPRGDAADHLTKDVVPFMETTYGVSRKPANWGIVGWSMGGTCAVDLTVMHPDLFTSFVDIAGDIAPNSGTKSQTIDRLFGGNAAQWAAFDPRTVMTRHGPYTGVSGWFAVSSTAAKALPLTALPAMAHGNGLGGQDAGGRTTDQTQAATALCGLGSTQGIDCAVVQSPGKHDWPFAEKAFVDTLPWLAGQLGTPGAPRIPLPQPTPPVTLQAAGR